MGIAMFTFGGLLAPLQGLVGWFMGPSPSPATKSIAPCVRPTRAGAQNASPRPVRRPLRVLRVVDGCHAPAAAGRMVISGRMADVCAELDRLAALEAAGS